MSERPLKKKRTDWSCPVQYLKGVGPDRAALLAKVGVQSLSDLIFFFPRKYQDYSNLCRINELRSDESASVVGVVDDIDQSTSGQRHAVFVLIKQDQQYLRAIWFNQPFLLQKFQLGHNILLRGTPRLNAQRWEMIQPKVQWLGANQEPARGTLIPVYPATEGLNQIQLRRCVQAAVDQFAEQLPEVFPEEFRSEHDLVGIVAAVRGIHQPADQAALARARRRLVYQELLVLQLAIALRRQRVRSKRSAPPLPLDAKLRARIERRFPFELSPSQRMAIGEIADDMSRPVPMNRLLHGDVGSGKTAVATFAMLLAVAHGYQAVLMTPTEILARQHVRTLKHLLRNSRVRIELLSGTLSSAEKRQLQGKIAAAEVDLIVGTSAVIYGEFQFERLGLVIIDEQHKFGVRQRARLRQAGLDPHYLVMTATPIPRTMALTTFGDLDVSVLKREHALSTQVHTYLAEESDREKWWEFFRRKLREGRQGYVIAPRVDSEADQAGAEQAFEALCNGVLADFRVDLLHGRQTTEEKEAAMLAFERGHTQVLVATSVVEVGVDVPNASVMTIESAQRFGLSQLHQMRGRVGRGAHPGYVCLFAEASTEESRQRLKEFAQTTDGFAIAELDFRTRGPGELFGTRQHGVARLRIADFHTDQQALERSRADARAMLEADPDLTDPRWARLKRLVLNRYGKLLELVDVG
jgi:ATP-dependent DNA helicase RecG